MTDPSFCDSESGRWFKEVADAHRAGGHYQGFYILTADGFGPTRLFDYPAWSPPSVLQFMDSGLKLVRDHKVAREPIPTQNAAIQPEAGICVIRQFTRMVDVPKDQLNSSVDRDHIWLYADEIKEIAETARASRGDIPVPATFAARLVRFHLIDSAGGRHIVWIRPRLVKSAKFALHPLISSPGKLSATFTGEYSCRNEDGQIGIDGHIAGRIEMNPALGRITRFRAYGEATAWGGGVPSTEPTPPDKFKLIFALIDVSDSLSRSIPPSDAWHPAYRDAHASEIPGLLP